MFDTVILIAGADSLTKLNPSSNSAIFSLDYITHNFLDKKKIHHKFAEDYLDQNDRTMIFDLTSSYHNWYKKKFLEQFNLDNVNLLGILDTAELHMLFIHQLKNFLIIKRIIEKEKPKKIIISKNLHDTIIPLVEKYKIQFEILEGDSKYYLEWDKIELKFNIYNKPVSIRISRSLFNKIKSVIENITCTIFNLWLPNNDKKKTILFLEINPTSYPELLMNLHNRDQNILFFNNRRPAIWNLQSINLLRKSNCKLINSKKIEKNESEKINSLTNHYLSKLNKLWINDEQFFDIFNVEGISIWPTIKQILFITYENRIKEYVALMVTSKKILESTNIKCIISSNVFGETEKAILNYNENLKPSILLEHAYANYTSKSEQYDILSMYHLFKDKIAVWGETQKKYLIEQKHIDSDKIISCGSPRHDSFFLNNVIKNHTSNKTVLLTIHSINEVSGQADTNLYIEFESLLREICMLFKKYKMINLVVKLHPNQDVHNEEIKKILNEVDPTIPIYHLKPIQELLLSCDTLINISPEGFDPSTVILEGLILNKPTMNIVIDDHFYDFQYEKDNAIISISANSNIEKSIHDIIFNDDLRQKLIYNGKHHIKNYLVNPGEASNCLAKFLSTL